MVTPVETEDAEAQVRAVSIVLALRGPLARRLALRIPEGVVKLGELGAVWTDGRSVRRVAARSQREEQVEIGCLGGHGRTGTALVPQFHHCLCNCCKLDCNVCNLDFLGVTFYGKCSSI